MPGAALGHSGGLLGEVLSGEAFEIGLLIIIIRVRALPSGPSGALLSYLRDFDKRDYS